MKKRISMLLIISLLAMCLQLPIFAETEFAMSNLVARRTDENIVLYWTNDAEISELYIVDKNTDTPMDTTNVETSVGAVNSLLAPLPQDAGVIAQYSITCNGNTVFIQESEKTDFEYDGWEIRTNKGIYVAEFVENAYQDKAAMHFTRYGDKAITIYGERNGIYESGKSYEMSFYYKAKGLSELDVRIGSTTNVEVTDSEEWTQFKQTFTISSSTPGIFIRPNSGNVDFWLADVRIHLLDDEGNPVGDSLIKNGDFSECTSPAVVNELNYSGVKHGVMLDWSEVNEIMGYMLWIDGVYTAFLDKSTTSYTINGMENDVEIEASIATKGNNGLLSEKTTITALTGTSNTPVPDQSAYQPKNVIVRQQTIDGAAQNTMIWTNPENAPSAAAVYKVSDNGETFVEGRYNLDAKSVNEIALGEIGSQYYKLKLDFADGTVMEYFANVASPNAALNNGWQGGYSNAKQGFMITNENPHNGEGYAYHMFRYGSNNADLKYQGDKSLFENGASYRLEFYYRGSNYNEIEAKLGSTAKIFYCTPSQTQWNYGYIDFENVPSNPSFQFYMRGTNTDIYLDSISVKKVENGETVGENIIENGDFETITKPAKIKNYTAASKDSAVDLSWELPSDTSCAGVNIYINGNLKGTFFSDKTQVTISGLINSLKNSVKIITVNNYGEPVGETEEFAIIPQPDDYSVGEAILKLGTDRVNRLSAGTFTVEAMIKNNQYTDMDAELVVAVYADDELISLTGDAEQIETTTDAGTTLNASFTLQPSDLEKQNAQTGETVKRDVKVKVFVLDGLNTRQVLAKTTIFE